MASYILLHAHMKPLLGLEALLTIRRDYMPTGSKKTYQQKIQTSMEYCILNSLNLRWELSLPFVKMMKQIATKNQGFPYYHIALVINNLSSAHQILEKNLSPTINAVTRCEKSCAFIDTDLLFHFLMQRKESFVGYGLFLSVLSRKSSSTQGSHYE